MLYYVNPYSQTISFGMRSSKDAIEQAEASGKVSEEELEALEIDLIANVCHECGR